MGVPITEFTIESVLRDGLGDLRANPSKLDDLFSKFTMAFFNNQFGQNHIDSIKTYITENQIKLVQAYSQVPTQLPCISIQLVSSEEREDEQHFSNEFLDDDSVSKTPTVYVPVVTPTTYDSITGRLSVDSAADLSTICPRLVYVDASSNKFTIQSGNSNIAGDKYINIGPNQTPDIGGDGRVESPIDFIRTERKMIRLREVIALGAHSKDDLHLSKYLYYIIYYILKSRQDVMIARGINLDFERGSMFDREDMFEGENVFSRFIEVHCLTEMDWDQGEANLIDCFDLDTFAEIGNIGTNNTNSSDDC